MSNSGAADGDDIAGLPVDEAVDVVVDRGEAHERTTARDRLDPVVEDGTVRRAALDDQAAEVSKVVATAETRTELAGQTVGEAGETAAPVADLDTVADQLDRFESELDNVREWRDRVSARLDDALDRKSRGSIYETTTALRDVRELATRVQRTADELWSDVETFEQWLRSPDRRYGELEGDLDALADSLADLAEAVDRLDEAIDEDGTVREGVLTSDDVGLVWADTLVRLRVIGLFVEDVSAELADLATWAERESLDEGPVDDLDHRVSELEDRVDALNDRVGGLSRSEWQQRFAGDLAAFDDDLSAYDPPVDWGGVHELLEEHRAELGMD